MGTEKNNKAAYQNGNHLSQWTPIAINNDKNLGTHSRNFLGKS